MVVTVPGVGLDLRALDDVRDHERHQRRSAPIRHDCEPQPACVRLSLVVRLAMDLALATTHLDRADHDRLVVDALTLAARRAADEALVDLDGELCPDGISLGTDHASAELVEHCERFH
jgi:hypothetical protein